MFRPSLLVFACICAVFVAGDGSSSTCPGIKITVDLIEVVNGHMDADLKTLNDTKLDLQAIPAQFQELRNKINRETGQRFSDLEKEIDQDKDQLEEAQKKCVNAVKANTQKRKESFETFLSKCYNQEAIDSALSTIADLEQRIKSVKEQVQVKREKLESMEDQCGKPAMVNLNGDIEALLRSRPGNEEVEKASQLVKLSEVSKCAYLTEGRTNAAIDNLELFNLACRT